MLRSSVQTSDGMGADARKASPGMLRFAGYALVLAVVTLTISAVALALFFTGAGEIFGPINDVFTALTLLLILPAILAVRELARGLAPTWFSLVSVVAIAGLVFAAAGFFLLVVRVIGLQASFVTFGIGMVPFLAWMVALAFVALRHDVVAPALGWWILGFLAVVAVALVAMPVLPMNILSLTLAPLMFITLAGSLLVLARQLLARA